MGGQRWRTRRAGSGSRRSDEAPKRAVTLEPADAAAFGSQAEQRASHGNAAGDRRIGWGGMPLPLEPRGAARDTGHWAQDAGAAARQVRVDSNGAAGRAELQTQGSGQGSKRRAQSVERQVSAVGGGAPDNIRIVSRASPEEDGELGSRRLVAAGEEAQLGLGRACSKRAKVALALDQRVTLSFRMPRVNPECAARLEKVLTFYLGPLSCYSTLVLQGSFLRINCLE